ncbi:unnamed protein product [Allacma fusca]|uniref:Uncharacterized protein n=1 Tax=Allacma fusca TaxID=39272 RepID=A0A8J2PER9_9HEXA|nr:unnamed protein product [Allacma fusca]
MSKISDTAVVKVEQRNLSQNSLSELLPLTMAGTTQANITLTSQKRWSRELILLSTILVYFLRVTLS